MSHYVVYEVWWECGWNSNLVDWLLKDHSCDLAYVSPINRKLRKSAVSLIWISQRVANGLSLFYDNKDQLTKHCKVIKTHASKWPSKLDYWCWYVKTFTPLQLHWIIYISCISCISEEFCFLCINSCHLNLQVPSDYSWFQICYFTVWVIFSRSRHQLVTGWRTQWSI